MGLLDLIQKDPEKMEALRQGLLYAGAQMMAGGRQDFGSSLGQGMGAGIGAYSQQRELAKKEAEKAKQKQAMADIIRNAQTPGRAAMPAMYGVGNTQGNEDYARMAMGQNRDINQMNQMPPANKPGVEIMGLPRPAGPYGVPLTGNSPPAGQVAGAPEYEQEMANILQARESGLPGTMSPPMFPPQAEQQMPRPQMLAQNEQLPEQAIQTREAQPGQEGGLDRNKLLLQMMQNPDAGYQEYALKAYLEQKGEKAPEAYTLAPGNVRFGADNKQIAAVPAAPKEGLNPYGQDMREWFAVNGIDPANATPQQLQAAYTATNQQKDRRAPRTSVVNNISQSTEKKFGEKFAEAAAGQDISSYEAAQKAPELAARSNRIKEVIASGKVITGFGADARLAFGKALGMAGASDSETMANTEALASDLSKNTLDAIKASGLGSGNGFSNADRDFLEKAAGGKITLEARTLSRLADLSHRAATLSAQKWNKRSMAIPRSALEGTGITSDPISVPPLFVPKAKPIPMKAPAGVDSRLWQHMTPEERKLWQK